MQQKKGSTEGEVMDARLEKVDEDLAEMKSSMELMRKEAADNQSKLIELMTWSLGSMGNRVNTGGKGEGSHKEKDPKESRVHDLLEMPTSEMAKSRGQRVDEDEMEEFRKSEKKVELTALVGEDPAGWISRAKIYFRI